VQNLRLERPRGAQSRALTTPGRRCWAQLSALRGAWLQIDQHNGVFAAISKRNRVILWNYTTVSRIQLETVAGSSRW